MASVLGALAERLLQSLRGAAARLAHQHDRLAARQLPGRKARERKIDRAGNMPGRIFMRLAHIDDGVGFRGDRLREGVVIDGRDAGAVNRDRRLLKDISKLL